ncbi:MAG: FtsQ-type POTRA domain-containing protein [Actinomycetes bacterium]
MTSLLDRLEAPATAARRIRSNRWWPLIATTAVLGVVLVLAWVVFWSPLLVVRSVVVDGASKVSTDQIIRAAGLHDGMPLARVNASDIRHQLLNVMGIADVSVSRSWSGTVTVTVRETRPAAMLREDGGYVLVSARGERLWSVDQRPASLPLVTRSSPGGDLDSTDRAAVTVATQLPPALRHHVETVSAASPTDVTVVLRNGTTVAWGTPESSPTKAQTVLLLWSSDRGAQSYDVSSPDSPSVVR